jgi:hypothetical protein
MLTKVTACFKGALLSAFLLSFMAPALYAGVVTIQLPVSGATLTGPVAYAFSASESQPFHLEVWDNGSKLGDYTTTTMSGQVQLANGPHTTTVQAVTSKGVILDAKTVNYTVGPPDSGSVSISSPVATIPSSNAVRITASAKLVGNSHLEIWDNGYKLGNVSSGTVDNVYVMPSGPHTLTVQSIAASGALLSKQSVTYQVVEQCTLVGQCDFDRLPADNIQGDCDPPQEAQWVANPCGFGVQGDNGQDPVRTSVETITESGVLANQGNLTLNGTSLHLMEMQQSQPSNVLFRGQSPVVVTTATPETHWQLDAYVYLPDPTAHQAFEMDAQYTYKGVWTKFYTECALNINAGRGYWAVFDSTTGGWIFLNGQPQGGQTPPVVPCNRSQFSQPWSGSSNPSFTGWHHINWQLLRNDDGTVTYQSVTFDSTTTQVNFHPNSATGGQVSDTGHVGGLIQLDGVVNKDRAHDLVDAYVSEISLIHQP